MEKEESANSTDETSEQSQFAGASFEAVLAYQILTRNDPESFKALSVEKAEYLADAVSFEEEEEEEAEKEDANTNEKEQLGKSYLARESKLVILVRTDLLMGKGKIAAQAGHAAIKAYKMSLIHSPSRLSQWERECCKKVALKVSSEAEITNAVTLAREKNIVAGTIYDAGRTQIEPGSLTVGFIGPAPSYLIDEITGSFKLL